jgi:Fe-S cluster assembly protein SufD
MDSEVYIIGRDAVPQFLRLDAGEARSMTLVVPPGTSACLGLEIDLCGPGASLDLAGVYLCNDAERVDLRVLVRHSSGGCTSRQLFKGIVGGTASASFDGLIYVAPDAQKTEAYQENHNIVLTDTAKVDTRPQLEIYADDVKCSHGATVGQLNADELFYMRSRGIPEAEARTLQMLSFLSPVIPAGREEEIERVLRSYAE